MVIWETAVDQILQLYYVDLTFELDTEPRQKR